MTDILSIKIEKSDLAQWLEDKIGVSWDIAQHFPFDAGYDVRACIETPYMLHHKQQVTIPTGIYLEMENPYWECQVRPRSGLAHKYGITIINSPGTVDYAYRDEIKVILGNLSDKAFTINPGDRIAQLCFRRVPQVKIKYVDKIEENVVFSEDYDWVREEKRKNTTRIQPTGNEMTKEMIASLVKKRGGFGSSGVE